MSFQWYARKVRDPERDIWVRWSSLHCCLRRVAMLRGQFSAQRQAWVEAWGIDRDNPPTEAQLIEALTAIETHRNQWLERVRAFEKRRIREKMRGKWHVTNAEREAVWRKYANGWQTIRPVGATRAENPGERQGDERGE